jgi:hypothetical protein
MPQIVGRRQEYHAPLVDNCLLTPKKASNPMIRYPLVTGAFALLLIAALIWFAAAVMAAFPVLR